MKQLIILFFIFFSSKVFGLSDTSLVVRENKLVELLANLRASISDDEKSSNNLIFKEYLFETLQQNDAFKYPFSKLKSVGFIDSPDGQLRIVNWNIEQADETQKYYCYLLHVDSKKKKVEYSELIDNSFMLLPRPDGILEAHNWYGALYYKIIPVDKGSKIVYTLLGWDGNSSMSTIKLIDVLYFSGNAPKLGSPIFKTKEMTYKRMFYEHSKKTTMSLKYEEEYDRIIFDHLSPEAPNLKGFYSFYVPDLSYDAFVLEGNKWILKEDVVGVNKGIAENTSVYVQNERNGKVEKKEIKNKWINPSDEKSPNGGSVHIAVTPEKDIQNPIAQKNEMDKKASKHDKRDPSNLNSTLGQNKHRRRRKS